MKINLRKIASNEAKSSPFRRTPTKNETPQLRTTEHSHKRGTEGVSVQRMINGLFIDNFSRLPAIDHNFFIEISFSVILIIPVICWHPFSLSLLLWQACFGHFLDASFYRCFRCERSRLFPPCMFPESNLFCLRLLLLRNFSYRYSCCFRANCWELDWLCLTECSTEVRRNETIQDDFSSNMEKIFTSFAYKRKVS